ncbi:enhancer of polycomb homolog 1 isoform X2 [Folsomia candida]|uniref:enhancer of polycomb homolog 1 isoform X2 n=1 Tax=Folsomia candida TaxID=158441 RepID=UPI000B8F71BC|nr:enhancer of polycomb homolog 1 isoform X2 [Folsomia candida]
MSKLSFRARALDASKALPIYHSTEIPDSADCSLINRAVPQMPTGMEKEEEAEHHLQQAIVSGTVIPTPEVFLIDNTGYYNKFYPESYKLPRQLIYMQPFSMETDIPDYDMDSEDENWVTSQSGKLELNPEKFEEMMDRLEKGSGQTVVTLQEAKALIKEDDDLIIAVYDYWLNKRLKIQQPLIPHVRTEARHGIANHNPYIAFRRRTEKMQTRKNRKNDESSYEKMLKLRRDLTRAVNLLEMVKKREKSKRELLHLTIEVFEKRTQAGDYSGQIVSEALQQRPARPAFTPLFQANSLNDYPLLASLSRKERRQYKKRRHKSSSKSHAAASSSAAMNYANAQGLTLDEGASSDDDLLPCSPSDGEEDEGVYAFRRKKDCEYLAPLDSSDKPWYPPEDINRLRFYPTSISDVKNGGYRMVGPCRRRVGRGGRIILDRMTMQDLSEFVQVMGLKSSASPPHSGSRSPSSSSQPEPLVITHPPVEVKQEPIDSSYSSSNIVQPNDTMEDFTSSDLGCWHHFRPRTPDPLETGEWLMISESDPSAEDESVKAEQSEESILLPPPLSSSSSSLMPLTTTPSTPFLQPSYHLGLVVSSGDRPITYPLETLLSDPTLPQNTLPSHIGTPGSHVVLDEQSSELENTCGLYIYGYRRG